MPQARLLLVGDGPHRAALDAKIEACGVGQSTIITGLIPQAHVPAMLSVADVTVLPYPQLPQDLWFSPLKLYEYMAAGKAIVGSRSGQIAEVLENGRTGLLVEPGNVPELTAAITALLKDPAKRQAFGQAAHQRVVEQHSWEKYIRRLETIYDQALKSRRR
jgi:glycosyltransferase involved in cell wall biosynthesis